MEEIFKNRKLLVTIVMGVSVLGLLLHTICRNGSSMAIPVILMLLTAAFSVFTAWKQQPRKDFLSNHIGGSMMLFALVGALFLLIAGIIWLVQAIFLRAVCALVCAAAIVMLLLSMMQQKKPFVLYPILLIAANIVMLVVQFRQWSLIPQIGKFCYLLFASVCILLISYQMLAFCYEIGSRRQALFLSMFGTFLCLSVLLSGSWAEGFWYFGWGLFLLCETDKLLFASRKRRTLKKPAPETEEQPVETVPETAPEETPEPISEVVTIPIAEMGSEEVKE